MSIDPATNFSESTKESDFNIASRQKIILFVGFDDKLYPIV